MRLLLLLLFMIGLDLVCSRLTQIYSYGGPDVLSPLDLARGHWLIEKDWDRSYLHKYHSPNLHAERHEQGMTSGQVMDQRMSNLATYAAYYQNDYIRYVRQRHGDYPTYPPQIVPPELLVEFDRIVDRVISDKASSDMLMSFVNYRFSEKASIKLLNRMTKEMRQRQATTAEEFSEDLMKDIGLDNEFLKYLFTQSSDDPLANIFTSKEVLAFLTADSDYQLVYRALEQAVEPHSNSASSSSRQW